MSREDFIEAGIAYRMEHGKPMCIAGSNLADVERDLNRVFPFEFGAEYGYQYAIKRSDNVIKLIVKMAKKDIAFTEKEAVKFYHEEMEV